MDAAGWIKVLLCVVYASPTGISGMTGENAFDRLGRINTQYLNTVPCKNEHSS